MQNIQTPNKYFIHEFIRLRHFALHKLKKCSYGDFLIKNNKFYPVNLHFSKTATFNTQKQISQV